MTKKLIAAALATALASCNQGSAETNDDADVKREISGQQPDGSPLTAEFCAEDGDSAYSPFGGARDCYLVACSDGDDASCEALKTANDDIAERGTQPSDAAEPRRLPEPELKARSVATKQTPSQEIWDDGQSVTGTCFAKHDGTIYMNGGCSGLGHGDNIFVTADIDGCTLDVTRNGNTATGTLFGYRNFCSDLSEVVDVGPFSKDGECWSSEKARFCLIVSP